ncbi:hypothetical protein RFF05_08230 [Bengtsoniella intestinalis]|uniref:hypothetical protein n=1 Tax=Bengtsoniella intestinalis TaxID=3073143 RepID=UPI00391F9575
MIQVAFKPFRCTSCLDRNFHHGISRLYNGTMLQSGECYCFGLKKPRKFKKSELKQAPPSWCPLRKSQVELAVFDFEDENARQMFSFMYDHCGGACTDVYRHQLISQYTVSFSAQDFWMADDQAAFLEDIPVPNFGIICFDDGLRKQYFFNENGFFVYQPYMRETKPTKGDTET